MYNVAQKQIKSMEMPLKVWCNYKKRFIVDSQNDPQISTNQRHM